MFTASTKEYADLILNLLDPRDEYFIHRLYRQHVSFSNKEIIKDLSRLNRDLAKTIIIDNLHTNFKLQPNNGLHIRSWTNDIWDMQLNYLCTFLKRIAVNAVDDIRPLIRSLKRDCYLGGNHEPDYKNIAKLNL